MKRIVGLCIMFCIVSDICEGSYGMFYGENGVVMSSDDPVSQTSGKSFSGLFWCQGATGKVVVDYHTVYPGANYESAKQTGIVMYGHVSSLKSGCFQNQSVTSVWVNASVTTVPDNSFYECNKLEEVVFPATLETFGANVFDGCTALETVVFRSDIPKGLVNSLALAWADAIYYPERVSDGWEKILKNSGYSGQYGAFRGDDWIGIGCVIPGSGNLKPEVPAVVTNYVFSTVTNHIYHHDVVTDMTAYHTTVTNVYVHYIKENAKPEYILPSSYDTGFVNVVAEVEGGFAVIPATWSVNYPGFTEKYGSDFSKALNKPNGKYDRHGNPMFVWQDYVAGTSPMDVDDVFDATIAIEGGEVVVSHTPVLDDDRAALRKYTVYGKKNLMDSEWKEVEPGEELNYNFYRVTVRMK